MSGQFRGNLWQNEDGTYRLDTYELAPPNAPRTQHQKFEGWGVVQELQAMHRRVTDALIARKNSEE